MTFATLTREMNAAPSGSEPLPLRESWRMVLDQTETGDYNDNLSLYLTALYAMRAGFSKEGLSIIQKLRKQINATGEGKSKEWLLPKLNRY